MKVIIAFIIFASLLGCTNVWQNAAETHACTSEQMAKAQT